MKNPKPSSLSSIKSNWYIWFFPMVALAVVAWLFLGFLRVRGPVIEITFDDASVIKPEKTVVRFRGVTIGVVKEVYITSDAKDVVARVQLQRDAEDFAVEGSKFWVVVPKVNLEGISGLGTLFEGSYIAVTPGNPDGNSKLQFNGREGSQATDPLDATSSYILETDTAGSVSVDDTVSFRGFKVGSVTKMTLSKSGQKIAVQINVQNRYVHLIRDNSVFWRKTGIQAQLGLFHSELKMGSLDSILHGGVEFATPNSTAAVSKSSAKFILYSSAPKEYEKWNPNLEVQ